MYNFFLLVKRYIFISYFSTFNDFKVNDLLAPAFIIQITYKINTYKYKNKYIWKMIRSKELKLCTTV